ncbi:LemA family protein [Patescibacteria group bacterium]
MEILLVLGIVVVGVAIFAIGIYNSLIVLKNKVDEGWADIDTQLKRRWDLIPNMVETVKGYAKHEDKVFVQVTQARSNAMQAKTPDEHAKAENMLTGVLKSLFAVAENYPELKANQNFLDLQATLREIEEHIQMSRRYYNGTVKDFNTKLQVFPNNVIAGFLGFKDREFFEIAEEERKNVKVSFKDEPEAPAAKPEEAPKEEEPKEEPPAEEAKAEEPPEEEEKPKEE